MSHTTHAVSKKTGLSSAQLRYRIKNGEIKARKYKGRYRISEDELKRLMRKNKRKSSKKRTSKKRSSAKRSSTKRKTSTKKVSIAQVKKAVQKANNKSDVVRQLENIRKKAKKKASSKSRSPRGDMYLVSSRGNYVKKVTKSDADEFLMRTSGTKKKRKR